MYYVSKRIELAYAHKLELNYESPCRRLHGHNAVVTIFCCSETLDEAGMVIDFKQIKTLVADRLDHAYANDVTDLNPTAENLARWICDRVPHCYKVVFQESEGNVAAYVRDGYENAAL